MKLFRVGLSLFAAALAASACGGEGEANVKPARLELLTWWTDRAELAAIDALVDVHRELHPEVQVTVFSSATHQALEADMQNRLAEGNPPAAFQENLGGKTLRWAGTAQSLNSRAPVWAEWFQPAMLDLVTVAGQIIGVPVAITRQNNAYYNRELLEELGLGIPEGSEELVLWLEDLAARGYTHPLCAGDTESWVSAHVLFEDIVPAHAGAEFSQAYWSGELYADHPTFLAALEQARSIIPYFNKDILTRVNMAPAVERLMERSSPGSQCVMAPMGDWGGAILNVSHQVDDDFVQRPWPGTEGLFVLSGDAFIAAKNQAETFDFFDTAASREGQVAFSARKGSLPARTLTASDFGTFGALTRQNMSELASAVVLPGYKVIGSGQFPWDALSRLTHDFFLSGDPRSVVDFMRDHYEKLALEPRLE